MLRAMSVVLGLPPPPDAKNDDDDALLSTVARVRARGVVTLVSVMRRPMACIISARRACASFVWWYAMGLSKGK